MVKSVFVLCAWALSVGGFGFFSSSVALAQQNTIVADSLVKVDVILPRALFPSVHGQIDLEHQPNVGRSQGSDEVTQKILYFIYREGAREMDRFDPSRGEGVLIPRASLGGFVDTDLLKAHFYAPTLDRARDRDVYPIDFKFRASMMSRVFKKAFVTAVRPVGERYWKVLYRDEIEVDGLGITVNALGEVTQMRLMKKGVIVKTLSVSELPTIPEREF